MGIIPFIFIGGALLFSTKKKKSSVKNGKALPESSRGTVFDSSELPDVIKANIGERFSISFPAVGAGRTRKLVASPPDNSVDLVMTEYDLGGRGYNVIFIFKGMKKGRGSIVFHEQERGSEGKIPPSEITEIQTEIS